MILLGIYIIYNPYTVPRGILFLIFAHNLIRDSIPSVIYCHSIFIIVHYFFISFIPRRRSAPPPPPRSNVHTADEYIYI